MFLSASRCLAAALLITSGAESSAAEELQPGGGPAERLLRSIVEPSLRALIEEALARNPGLEAGEASASAAAQGALQHRALPDPNAEVTAFAATPETRVGPQRLTLSLSQALPWRGKLGLRGQIALQEAAALESAVQARRLKLVTEVRRLCYELAFLDHYRDISRTFRAHLIQHEEISRARYSTGVGSAQAVLKLQAEITRAEQELLELEARGATLTAQLNALRDRPATTPVQVATLPAAVEERTLVREALLESAHSRRPELEAAEARIVRAGLGVALSRKAYKPDFTVGLTYTLVDPRRDPAGRLAPPDRNGEDILGLRGGVRLPIWRKKRSAGLAEALDLQSAAMRSRREVEVAIDAEIGDLTQRLPLAWRRLRLVVDLLVVQAEEALESAQAGYVAGTLNALDLLDAEHVLFDALTAAARAKADYLIGFAELEGAAGGAVDAASLPEGRS